MGDTKIQWHPGFVAAMNLEFAENRDDLKFEPEYNLNTKPLEIDLLVIKKQPSVSLSNEVGRFFRGHNIMEYKSPEDLFQYLKKHGHQISNPYKGIYYIDGNLLFPIQIVVTRELNRPEHLWLGSLSNNMNKQEMKELFNRIHQMEDTFDRELADSVLEVSIGANKEMVEKWKGDDIMCQALMEIMEPEIRLKEKEWKEAGMQKGIQDAVDMLRNFGHPDEEIKLTLMNKYDLSTEEAEKYFQ